MKSWLKAGLIGGVIGLILGIVNFFLMKYNSFYSNYSFPLLIISLPWNFIFWWLFDLFGFCYFGDDTGLPYLWASIVLGTAINLFLIGLLIGFIIQKIKSKSK